MSFAKNFRQVAVPVATAITLAFAANANAAPTLELDQLDLSKPIPSGCFESNSKGTAISKLKTAMFARGQKSVVAGNQVVVGSNPYQELIFTSNLQKGGEGYEINSDKPMGQIGTGYCLQRNQAVYIYSVFNSQGVPNEVKRGEMGKALTNQDKAGTKVALTILTEQGSIAAVNFNPLTGKGTHVSADGNGNTAANLAFLVNTGYSSSLPDNVKAALGIPLDNNLQK
jgi:hypothetical protein